MHGFRLFVVIPAPHIHPTTPGHLYEAEVPTPAPTGLLQPWFSPSVQRGAAAPVSPSAAQYHPTELVIVSAEHTDVSYMVVVGIRMGRKRTE